MYIRYLISPGLALVCIAVALGCPRTAHGLDASTILEKSADRVQIDSFRVGVRVKTLRRGRKPYEYSLWLMGQNQPSGTSIFVDFEEPKHTRGLRFLFRFHEKNAENASEGYMFLRATNSYVRLKPSNQGREIGGTGLTMADFRGFVPKRGEKAELMGRETLNGHPCYVVAVYSRDGNMTGKYWIARKDFAVVKSVTFGTGGKPIREFHVLEFFEDTSGKRYPRRQKIIDKVNNSQIELVHEAGVYNILLPDDLMDPTKFGTVQWRTVGQ